MMMMKKIWGTIRSWWYVPFMILLALVAGLKRGKINEVMGIAKESMQKQKEALEVAEAEREYKKKKIKQEYKDAVRAIDKIYTLQKKEVSRAKLKKVKKITQLYYNDKEKISKEITNEFGFQYTPRPDNSSSDDS